MTEQNQTNRLLNLTAERLKLHIRMSTIEYIDFIDLKKRKRITDIIYEEAKNAEFCDKTPSIRDRIDSDGDLSIVLDDPVYHGAVVVGAKVIMILRNHINIFSHVGKKFITFAERLPQRISNEFSKEIPKVDIYDHNINMELFLNGGESPNKKILEEILKKERIFFSNEGQGTFLFGNIKLCYILPNIERNFWLELSAPHNALQSNPGINGRMLDLNMSIQNYSQRLINSIDNNYNENLWREASSIGKSIELINTYICPIIEREIQANNLEVMSKF